MSFPSIRFRVGFDTTPLEPLAAPTDLAGRVESFTFDYGKQSALDDFQPGTSTVVLANDDRFLDRLSTGSLFPSTSLFPSLSLFPGGPLAAGSLKPRKRCVLDATYSGTTYDQFTTFADGWPQSNFTPTTSEVVLGGTDLFILLGNMALPPTVYEYELSLDSPVLRYRLNESAGYVAHDSSANKFEGTYALDASAFTVDGLIQFDPDKGVALFKRGTATAPSVVRSDPVPVTQLPFTVETWIRPNQDDRDPAAAFNLAVFDFNIGGVAAVALILASTAGTQTYAVQGSGTAKTAGGINTGSAVSAQYNFDVARHVAVAFDGTTVTVSVDGVSTSSGMTFFAAEYGANKSYLTLGGGDPVGTSANPFQGGLDEVAVYDSGLSSAQLLAHYGAGHAPWDGDMTGGRIGRIADYAGLVAGDRDIDTGITTLGPTGLGGDALAYMQSIALSEDGQLFVEHRNSGKLTFYDRYVRYTATRSTTSQATFTDEDAAGAGAYRFEPDGLKLNDDESQIVNEAVVQWDQGEIRVSDADSIVDHGLKSRTYTTRLKSAVEAQAFGEWQVATYKDSHTRVESLTLNPAANSHLWVPALSLRYLDRITFRFKPQNTGTPIQQDYWIQGIHVEASTGIDQWLTTYYVTPASAVGADVEVFILDSSLLDGSAILAY